MRSDEQRYKTIGLMIFTAIIIFSVVGIVIIGFKMVKKNEEAKLVAAADTEYMKKQKNIKKAYLVTKIERKDDISYLLVVEFKGERKSVFEGIAEAVKPSLGYMRLDMHEADEKAMELIGEVAPFYKKTFLGL